MDNPSENIVKKKKPRRHRKKIVKPCVDAAQGVAQGVAETALKTSLKKRLQARRKMLQVARKGGTSQEVQSILQKFNDGDEEKMNLMKDIQDDVKGMKQKDAKQYMKRVLSGMNKDQTETFVDMVKDKMPSQQSSEIVNYVKRNRSVKEKEDTKKPQVNPESVYTPAKNLSAEEKATERARRSQRPDVPQASTSTLSTLPVKKKKGFGKININVPKLAELRNHPVLDEDEKHEETKKKSVEAKNQPGRFPTKSTTSIDRKKEIESIFPPSKEMDAADRNEHEVRRLQMGNRVKCLKMFSPTKLEEKLKCAVLESASEVQLVRIKDITFLPVPEVLDVPGSEETVTDVIVDSEFLCLGDWIFRKNDKGVVVKTLNAHEGCVEFVKKVEPVKQWLLTLIERRVPWKWLCDELNDLGILNLLKQKVDENIQSKQNVFKLLCHEFPNSSDKMSVPIIPFMTIVIA